LRCSEQKRTQHVSAVWMADTISPCRRLYKLCLTGAGHSCQHYCQSASARSVRTGDNERTNEQGHLHCVKHPLCSEVLTTNGYANYNKIYNLNHLRLSQHLCCCASQPVPDQYALAKKKTNGQTNEETNRSKPPKCKDMLCGAGLTKNRYSNCNKFYIIWDTRSTVVLLRQSGQCPISTHWWQTNKWRNRRTPASCNAPALQRRLNNQQLC